MQFDEAKSRAQANAHPHEFFAPAHIHPGNWTCVRVSPEDTVAFFSRPLNLHLHLACCMFLNVRSIKENQQLIRQHLTHVGLQAILRYIILDPFGKNNCIHREVIRPKIVMFIVFVPFFF